MPQIMFSIHYVKTSDPQTGYWSIVLGPKIQSDRLRGCIAVKDTYSTIRLSEILSRMHYEYVGFVLTVITRLLNTFDQGLLIDRETIHGQIERLCDSRDENHKEARKVLEILSRDEISILCESIAEILLCKKGKK